MAHRFGFRQLSRILALADRRMIAGDLPDAFREDLVQAGIADMTDRGPAILDPLEPMDVPPAPVRATFSAARSGLTE